MSLITLFGIIFGGGGKNGRLLVSGSRGKDEIQAILVSSKGYQVGRILTLLKSLEIFLLFHFILGIYFINQNSLE